MKEISDELKGFPLAPTTAPVDATGNPRQSFLHRLMMFGAGGIVSYVLNTGIFLLLRRQMNLTEEIAYAISLTVMTAVTFSWSYFVNFRTSASFKSCLKRYLITMAFCYVLNYVMAQIGFELFPGKPKLIILIVMTFLAGVKFLIYHWWVFPHEKAAGAAA